jgi:fatty-acyl-CoA synthase
MNFADTIRRHADAAPDRVALHFAGKDTSYQQLWQQIEAATDVLLSQGVQPGDRVAWLGLNDPAMLVLLFALSRLGAILLPLNYRLAPLELAAILAHAQPQLLVADDANQETGLALAASEKTAIFQAHDLLADRAEAGNVSPSELPESDETAPALLVYTSGTTGKPKGALHTQAGLVANCMASVHAHGFTHEDHVLTALPMFHVGGLCIQTLPALCVGARVTLHARFDASAWLHDVQALRPSVSLLVPATLRAVLAHPDFAATDVSSLKLLNAGSSSIPHSMIEAFHARGVPVCQVYGATETGPVSIYLLRDEAMQHAGSAGRAGLNVAVRLVDEAGKEVAAGEMGEIWLRAPNVMREYWRDPGNASFQDGWFHTGDLARQDADGYYWVVGRSKDMIISGGENVYPAEIENILADCPLIAEVSVIGVPDELWGEVAVAVVVLTPRTQMASADVLKLLEGKLARFKHPRQVVFEAALPKTALGKVQKPELAKRLSNL